MSKQDGIASFYHKTVIVLLLNVVYQFFWVNIIVTL